MVSPLAQIYAKKIARSKWSKHRLKTIDATFKAAEKRREKAWMALLKAKKRGHHADGFTPKGAATVDAA